MFGRLISFKHLGTMSKETRLLSALLASQSITDYELETTEFQVLKTGEYYDHRYGKFKVTEELLKSLKENFDKNVLEIDIALDANHEPEKGAYAWIKELSIKDGALWAKFRDYTEDAKKMFKQKIFRYFSVEFSPFTKVEGGKQVTIKDVLRGIALTNRPVIKGMQPTFMSEETKEQINNHSNMSNAVKVFGEHVLARGKVNKTDVDAMKVMVAALSEEEKKEAEETVAKVEAEAEKTAEAEAAAAKEAADKAAAEAGSPEAAKAAEAKKLAEAEVKELAQLREEKATRVFSERAATIALSEDNLTGFAEPEKEKVLAFVKTLSEEQFNQFSELVKAVKTVSPEKLSELGSGKAGVKTDDEDAKLSEVTALAEKYEKEGMLKHVAVEKAQREVFGKK